MIKIEKKLDLENHVKNHFNIFQQLFCGKINPINYGF